MPKHGIRQRSARTAAQAAQAVDTQATNALSNYLLETWAWGQLSLPVLQKIADCATQAIKALGCEPPRESLRCITMLLFIFVFVSNDYFKFVFSIRG